MRPDTTRIGAAIGGGTTIPTSRITIPITELTHTRRMATDIPGQSTEEPTTDHHMVAPITGHRTADTTEEATTAAEVTTPARLLESGSEEGESESISGGGNLNGL